MGSKWVGGLANKSPDTYIDNEDECLGVLNISGTNFPHPEYHSRGVAGARAERCLGNVIGTLVRIKRTAYYKCCSPSAVLKARVRRTYSYGTPDPKID